MHEDEAERREEIARQFMPEELARYGYLPRYVAEGRIRQQRAELRAEMMEDEKENGTLWQ